MDKNGLVCIALCVLSPGMLVGDIPLPLIKLQPNLSAKQIKRKSVACLGA